MAVRLRSALVHVRKQWWVTAVESGSHLDVAQHATISGDTDMAWQKLASGWLHNLLSGHKMVIGAKTHKPIVMCIKTKFCRVFSLAKSKGLILKNHQCDINHSDSSGSMEADALVDMDHELDTKWKVHMVQICSDDDLTMRAWLQGHSGQEDWHQGTARWHLR